MSSDGTDRPERRTKTLQNGDTVHEAGDCRFVASPSGKVHERDSLEVGEHDYTYHPTCGQRLPAGSLWSGVDADSPEEAVVRYDLDPCVKCFPRKAYELRQKRREARRNHHSVGTE